MSPVQFAVQMNTKVPVAVHSLNVHTLDVQWLQWRMFVPAEVYHQLLGFTGIDLEVVQLASVHKVLSQSSVLLVVPISDEADYCRVIRELLQEALGGVVGEVCSVDGEEERSQNRSLWGPVLQTILSDTQP